MDAAIALAGNPSANLIQNPDFTSISYADPGGKPLTTFYGQFGSGGPTTKWWQVSFGAQTLSIGTINLASQSFSGWQQVSLRFTPTSTSQTLSFLAGPTPSGEPPFSLLGGLDLEFVPEVSNWMAFVGFGAVCLVLERARNRRQKAQPRLALAQQPENL